MKHKYLDDKTIAIQCSSTLRNLIELSESGVAIQFPKALRETIYDDLLDEELKYKNVSTIRQVKQRADVIRRFNAGTL